MDHNTSDYVNPRYPYSETTSRIIAAGQQVHHHLGPGFREIFYQRALALELPVHQLAFSREVRIPVYYRGTKLGHSRVDFIVEDVLVEIKAKGRLEAVDLAQTLSYLKAAGAEIGLLLNFGAQKIEIKRLIHSGSRDR